MEEVSQMLKRKLLKSTASVLNTNYPSTTAQRETIHVYKCF